MISSIALSCSTASALAVGSRSLRFLFLLGHSLSLAGVCICLFSVEFRLCFSYQRRAWKIACEFCTIQLRSLSLSDEQAAPWPALEGVAQGFLLGFSHRIFTLTISCSCSSLLSVMNMKLTSDLLLLKKYHFFLHLLELTWISGDSVIKENRIAETVLPLLMLQAAGWSSCSFTHLFSHPT